MKDLTKINYFEPAEKIVKVLCQRTQNDEPLFFRILVAYYLTKVASMMRCNIKTHDRGDIPVSMYAINLGVSGFGKGHATNILEEQVLNQFRERFMGETFPLLADINLTKLSIVRSNKKASDQGEELIKVQKEFDNLGHLPFSFDSGTPAAVKQMRHKLLMAEAGSMNMEIDEIGSNLVGNVEVLNTYLELYDVGKIKQKLTKNTAENIRSEEIDGRTPTNMMLFGTPVKLFNGGKVEEEFMEMLSTGYARRCFFGTSDLNPISSNLTAEQVYDMLTDVSAVNTLTDISDYLGNIADGVNFNKTLVLSKEVSILLIEYKMHCEMRAAKLAEHEEIKKAELSHRYFKTLKLAGTYAFIQGNFEITEEVLYNAIKLTEDSGVAFTKIITRDRNYVKLAKYISSVEREVTHVDLVEDLAFYKGSESQKREMMTLATAYGYKNNIIIKKHYLDGIEFLKGESLKETTLEHMTLSYSTQLAEGYIPQSAKFSELHKLTNASGLHWVNHTFTNNYRLEENVIAGFNMVTIDVDDGCSLATAKLLLKEYTYLIHTTKRHTEKVNRYRIILPISHELRLDNKDFKEFMKNVYEWLPFGVDDQTNQRSRKWLSCPGHFEYNYGEVLDALLFIPKTSKNEQRKQLALDNTSLSNIERWFCTKTTEGNRSNQLIKYGLMLVDSGLDLEAIKTKVLALNNKLPNKLDDAEIGATIMVSVFKAIIKRESK